MNDVTVPGTPGRRSPFVPLLLLVGYLLLAPWKVFFLGPVALMLLLSRPRTWREWLWIGVTALAVVSLWRVPGTLADQLVRSAGLFFTGAFVVASLTGVRSAFGRSAVAAAAAAAATIGWSAAFGIRWDDLRAAVVTTLWTGWRLVFPELPELPPEGAGIAAGATGELAAQLAVATRAMGDFFPALLVLTALAGGALAAAWYHRIASAPVGPEPGWFRTFRFNDHVIWLLVLALAAAMTAPAGPLAVIGQNLLVAVGGLYAARGLAVVRWITATLPLIYTLLLLVMVPFLLPLAVAFAVIGVADTWLDLRRRWPLPSGET